MAVSIVNTGCFIGAALLQPLFGWVADRTWDGKILDGVRIYSSGDYNNGLMMILGFSVIGLLATLMVRETHCKNITITSSGST